MRRGLLVALLSACGGPPNASSPSPWPAESATPGALATATMVASAPVAPAVAPSAPIQCDERDLETVLVRREDVGVFRKPDNSVDKRVRAGVIACFEEIPRERRSTDAVHAVTIEWDNSAFEGPALGGFGRGSGGGGGDYPPKVMDEAFTACVTKAVPRQVVSSIDPDASKIRAIKLTVLAYTRGAVNRHLIGGLGGTGAGFGRATRPCERPDRDE